MIRKWYKEEGLIQFMLGNQILNPCFSATGGCGTMLFMWAMAIIVMYSVYCFFVYPINKPASLEALVIRIERGERW